MNDCGGCQGLGAHRRWCPWSVGAPAAFYGKLSERAESLGDTVGANETGAANYLYAAAALLKKKAELLRDEYQGRSPGHDSGTEPAERPVSD